VVEGVVPVTTGVGVGVRPATITEVCPCEMPEMDAAIVYVPGSFGAVHTTCVWVSGDEAKGLPCADQEICEA